MLTTPPSPSAPKQHRSISALAPCAPYPGIRKRCAAAISASGPPLRGAWPPRPLPPPSSRICPPFRRPIFDKTTHVFVHGRSVVKKTVLKLSARGVGSLDKHKDSAILFRAVLDKRLNPVRAEIAVYGDIVGGKRAGTHSLHRSFAEEGRRIAGRRRADVIALCVRNDDQSLFRSVAEGLFKRFQTRYAVHFIIGNLHLDGRNDIIQVIDELFVELENPLCRRGKILDPLPHFSGR